jgi:hypothetical protein
LRKHGTNPALYECPVTIKRLVPLPHLALPEEPKLKGVGRVQMRILFEGEDTTAKDLAQWFVWLLLGLPAPVPGDNDEKE